MKWPVVNEDFLRSEILKETVDLLHRVVTEFRETQTITPVTYGNALALVQLINFYLKENTLSHERKDERKPARD